MAPMASTIPNQIEQRSDDISGLPAKVTLPSI
jgi:hypothetical protein